jgi:hypothetical protein
MEALLEEHLGNLIKTKKLLSWDKSVNIFRCLYKFSVPDNIQIFLQTS